MMSPSRIVGRWAPYDTPTDRGVPVAFRTYQFLEPDAGERRLMRYLYDHAPVNGEITDISQATLARALHVDERTIRRWTATVSQLRMVRASRAAQTELYVYTLRPPAAWISHRDTGQVPAAALREQLGEPVTREQLDAWKARHARPSDRTTTPCK